jgi:ribosome maturation factor RimP
MAPGLKAPKAKTSSRKPPALSGQALGRLLTRAKPLAETVCGLLGLEFFGLETTLEGGRRIVRAIVDRPGSGAKGAGVKLDELATVARKLSALLDETDPEADAAGEAGPADSKMEPTYVLEVSSPGLNRRLEKEEDFRRYSGRLAKIKLRGADGQTVAYRGRLATAEGPLRLVTEDGEITFELEPILKAALVPEI